MNRAIPNEIVDEIRARTDIVDIINDYAALKKKGHTWESCCPFHTEKTPSFKVNQQRQMYYCFGCEAGGDVFKFIMEKENLDFPTAVHLLAERCNVIIPENTQNNGSSNKWQQQQNSLRNRLLELHEFAKNEYQKNLQQFPNNPVSIYVKNRQMPQEGLNMFSLGASLNGFDIVQKATNAGYSKDELLKSGIAAESKKGNLYDRFFNRLIFPIWNETGKVVAFSSRTVETEKKGAKYVNSPESLIFKKSNVLYALPLARKAFNEHGFGILCEGQIDVMAMHLAGYKNSVAPQGTALTDEQCRILKRYTETLYFMFDSDNAGQKAIRRGIEIALPIGFDIKVITMPQGGDPDEIYKNSGAEGIKEVVGNAVDFFTYLMNYYCESIPDAMSPGGKGKIVNELLKFIQMIKNAVTRSGYVSMLSERLNINENAIFSELNDFKNKVRTQQQYAQKRAEKVQQNVKTNVKSSATANVQPNIKQGVSQNIQADDDSVPHNIDDNFHHEEQSEDSFIVEDNVQNVNLKTNDIDIPNRIKQAEIILLQYAIDDYKVAHMLSTELPVDLISQHTLGRALEEVIRVSVNGEHDLAVKYLAEFERNHPNDKLRKLLIEPVYLINEESEEKAIAECVFTVKLYALKQHKIALNQQLKENAGTDEEDKIFAEYWQIEQDIKKMSAEHKQNALDSKMRRRKKL